MCDAVGSLKINKAVGPDNIPAYIIKGMIGFFAEPLRILFNMSIKTGCFPKIWKDVKICPVFKKGDLADIKNYRPIAILSCPAKIFESIMYRFIYSYVCGKVTCRQHGFLKNKSTATNLCFITQFISESLDKKYQVDVVYTDFTKAFDQVSHRILLEKLKYEYGLSNRLVQFFHSYLKGRQQKVFIRGHSSK